MMENCPRKIETYLRLNQALFREIFCLQCLLRDPHKFSLPRSLLKILVAYAWPKVSVAGPEWFILGPDSVFWVIPDPNPEPTLRIIPNLEWINIQVCQKFRFRSRIRNDFSKSGSGSDLAKKFQILAGFTTLLTTTRWQRQQHCWVLSARDNAESLWVIYRWCHLTSANQPENLQAKKPRDRQQRWSYE